MATGPEHYQFAEMLLAEAARAHEDVIGDAAEGKEEPDPVALAAMSGVIQAQVSMAQVHATLALAAATALPLSGQMTVADCDAWEQAAGTDEAIARRLAEDPQPAPPG